VSVVEDLEARQAHVVEQCRRDGEVTVDPVDPTDAEPEISVRVKAPGGAAGHDASFKYSEVYRRAQDGFELVEYAYGFWSQRGLGSLEYHWHPLPWSDGQSIHHIHCRSSARPRGHFRAHVMAFDEARTSLRLIWASASPVDCSGFYPM